MYVHNILYYCFNISVPAGQEYISPRIQSVLSTTVNVTWSPPRFPNGLLTRYEVYRYDPTDLTRPNLATSTLGTMLNALVTGLAPYTDYQISIRACNSKGCTGHSSRASFQTLPDGKIFYYATVSLHVVFEISFSLSQAFNIKSYHTYDLDRLALFASLFNTLKYALHMSSTQS